MSIDEAITHCLEVADGQTAQGKCPECAEDHRQLAEWLTDYKRLKEQEPKTGHWIFDEILDKHYYCSECKSMGVDYWDFCPNCGARMIEPQESEDKE